MRRGAGIPALILFLSCAGAGGKPVWRSLLSCPAQLAADHSPHQLVEVYRRLLTEAGAGVLGVEDLSEMLHSGNLFLLPDRGASEREPLREGLLRLENAFVTSGAISPQIVGRLRAVLEGLRKDIGKTGERDRARRRKNRSPEIRRTLGDLKSVVTALVFSPDGGSLYAGTSDGKVYLLDPRSRGEPPKRLLDVSGSIHQLVYPPSGELIAVGKQEVFRAPATEFGPWKNLAVGSAFMTSPGSPWLSASVSADGRWGAMGNGSGELLLFPLDSTDSAVRHVHQSGVWQRIFSRAVGGERKAIVRLQFSPDGKSLWISPDWEMNTVLQFPRDPVSHGAWKVFVGSEYGGYPPAFSSDGSTLYSDGIVWSPGQPEERRVFSGAFRTSHTRSVLSPDGKLWIVATEAGLAVFDAVTAKQLGSTFLLDGCSVDDSGDAHSAAFSPDGNSLAVGSLGGAVYLWNFEKVREQEMQP